MPLCFNGKKKKKKVIFSLMAVIFQMIAACKCARICTHGASQETPN